MTTITLDYEQLQEACENAGLSGDALRPDYSGRAMYGSTCLGIVVDSLDELLAFIASFASFGDDWDSLTSGVRQDSMGLSTIYYWPNVGCEARS